MRTEHSIHYVVEPVSRALGGELRVPGDKSISHRSVMFAALARGESDIRGFLDSADTRATMAVLRQMGVQIEQADTQVKVKGVGMQGLQPPSQALDFGNSGTSVRLLAGILAGQRFNTELTGDASLMSRPMRRIAEPLKAMGAVMRVTEAGTLPMSIQGQPCLRGIHYAMPVASAQLKSSILLAGLYADGDTSVVEPAPSRDHTERMLAMFACPVSRRGHTLTISAGELQATSIAVPADISSAAFFLVAASIIPGSDITLIDVGMNPTRHAIVSLLQAMGADIHIDRQQANETAEPKANLRVRHSALQGITVPKDSVAIAIDELPILMIAAAVAKGTTILRHASELRVKESDRIAAMVAGLHGLGIEVEEFADGMQVTGSAFSGGRVASFGDHRIAMAFSIAGLVATAPVEVTDCANVATSFPSFTRCINQLGANITVMPG